MIESDSTTERWLPCVGFEGLYAVSSTGRVRSLDRIVAHGTLGATRRVRARVLKFNKHKGYHSVTMCKNSKPHIWFVHHVVLEAFVGPRPVGMECRHLNDIHDDNRIENIVWGTHKENGEDMARNGKVSRGEKSNLARLVKADVLLIRKRYAAGGISQQQLGELFGISQTQVGRIARRVNWTHV